MERAVGAAAWDAVVMTRLEQILDGSVTARNFDAVARLLIDTGDQSFGVRIGTADATFTAADTSASTVVSHGLGRTPVVVVMQERGGGLRASVDARSDTTFTFRGYTTQGTTLTNTVTYDWLVIG